ncbi:MAG: phage baseplate assembly protein V [Gammaproteobacteria bacterium]|nr:phage baseplate assembly protein V [Gammaproteobacteria bacterium]
MTSTYEHTEHDRLIANVVRLGIIEAVDHDRRRLRVRSGETVTDWLPWPTDIGRHYIRWRPLRIGTQVVLAAQSGDLTQAGIVGMLYTQSLDAPASGDAAPEDVDIVQWDDGTQVAYRVDTRELRVHSAGDLYLSAKGTLWMDAERIRVFEA